CTGSNHLRRELIQKSRLRGDDLPLRLLEAEPFGTIDLGKFLPAAGSGRPLEREHSAPQRFRLAIALKGPRLYDLAALLLDLRQRQEGTVRDQSRFLLEFPESGRKGFLPFAV